MKEEGSEQSPMDESSELASPHALPDSLSPVGIAAGQTQELQQTSTEPTPPAAVDPNRRRRPLEWLKSELAISKGLESDYWSHRRGEPRTFAFLWAIYLMIGSIIALGIVLAGGIITLDTYQPLSRGLVVTLAVGVLVFWPLIRLSQAAPEEGSRKAILQDLAVVLIPLQAVLWPQMYLARWTYDIVAATALAILAWGAIVGALLVIALRREDTWRSAWMAVILVIAIGGAGSSILYGSVAPDLLRPPEPGAAPAIVLASGVGLVADISADRSWSGSWALVLPEHWLAIRWTFVVAVLAWVVALWFSRSQRGIEYNPRPETGGPVLPESLDSVAATGSPESPGGSQL